MEFMKALAALHVLAARGRLIRDLINGDPVAWTITGVVVAAMVGWTVYKKKAGGGDGGGTRE